MGQRKCQIIFLVFLIQCASALYAGGQNMLGAFLGNEGGTGYDSRNDPSLSLLYNYAGKNLLIDAGLQYAGGVNITGRCSLGINLFQDSPVTLYAGAGPLIHTEFLGVDAAITDLLLCANARLAIPASGTALSLTAGGGLKHTLVYDLIGSEGFLIVTNALLSARLSQKVFGKGELGLKLSSGSYFRYPRLFAPSMSLDARWKFSEHLTAAGELLLRFTSISAQENTQLEHAGIHLGAVYAF